MFCLLLLWKGTVKVNVGRLVGWGRLTAEGAPNKRLLLFHGLAAPRRGEGWKVLSKSQSGGKVSSRSLRKDLSAKRSQEGGL